MLTPVELNALYVAMGIGIAGFILSLILLIKDIYVSFFIRPDLFIEIRDDEPATFRPELQIPNTNISRQALKVRVVNRGKGVATDCIAKFRITGWTGNTRHPSTDSKILRWDDGSHNKIIYPRGEEEALSRTLSLYLAKLRLIIWNR